MKISITGHGVVGRAIEDLLKNSYEVSINEDKADIIFVCVPTPESKDGSCDISIVESVISKVEADLIIIKSTIPPGTTDNLVKKYNKNIIFSPEYLGESKYYNPFFPNKIEEIPFIIAGGSKKDCNKYFELMTTILGPTKKYYKTSALDAEMIKYMENIFFATKITFTNEMFEICQKLGADWYNVREGWLLDPRVSKMHTSVFANKRGFSGKCYPKDLSAIIKKAEEKGYEPKLLKQVQKSNEYFKNQNLNNGSK